MSEIRRYFVSYAHASYGGPGFGSCEVKRSEPIRGHEDTTEIKRQIEAGGRAQNVVVLNWRRFEESDD